MFNLQDRIKGIDKDREYHATRISIRDKLLSQGSKSQALIQNLTLI